MQALLSGDPGSNASDLPNVPAIADATLEDGSLHRERVQALLSGDPGSNTSDLDLPNIPAMADATVEDRTLHRERVCEDGGGARMTLLPVLIPRTEPSSGTIGRYYFLSLTQFCNSTCGCFCL
jgi:hypothetical protein